jgi:DNA-binding transcriptional LysR family regulator
MHVQRDLQERGYAFLHSIDLSSAEAVKRIVASGVGVGVLFASAVRDELQRGELVALPVREPAYEQPYFIVRPETASTPQADRLCAFLRDELARVRRQ